MVLKTRGIILKQRPIGEQDKIITILTDQLGTIEASARRVKHTKSKLAAAIQPLAFCEFTLTQRKERYIVNSAVSIELFYNIRLDVVKLSLASYFCELMAYIHPTEEMAATYQRLLLNTLHFLAEGKRKEILLKAVYELRLLSISGFMPDLVACRKCAGYESDIMYFYPLQGTLLCEDCSCSVIENASRMILTNSVLTAMRHILYSPTEKLFRFTLSERSLKSLSEVTEHYMLCQIDRTFRSLDMYHSITLEE